MYNPLSIYSFYASQPCLTPLHTYKLFPTPSPAERCVLCDPISTDPFIHFQRDERAQVVVIGASAVDITSQTPALEGGHAGFLSQSTTRGTVALSVGGVARNIAEATHRVLSSNYAKLPSPDSTLLISPIGGDSFADVLVKDCENIKLRTDGLLRRTDSRTAVCNMVVDSHGALIGGVADMNITQDTPADEVSQRFLYSKLDYNFPFNIHLQFIRVIQYAQPNLVALDGNLSAETISSILNHCAQNKISSEHLTKFLI